MTSKSAPKRGLVLGGGGTLGAAWAVGALCALEEVHGFNPGDCDYIVGTSAGSIVHGPFNLPTGAVPAVQPIDVTTLGS